MQQHGERRALGVRRVPVERIVDVCSTSSASGSAFQGWSVNVSGRGMSVRATHLPELQAPIVVRFQEHGSEVIAEGVVVWRNQSESGSEFGVRFTALDSRSVQALKALCQAEPLPSIGRGGEPPPEEDHDTEPAPPTSSSAPPSLRLHIEGLAAPMQARVRKHGSKQLALGSPLDFLRVGRDVDIEDAALGERRRARIDAVAVDVDPDSRVPELVVSLSYDATAAAPRVRTAPPPSAGTRVRTASPPAAASRARSTPPPAPSRVRTAPLPSVSTAGVSLGPDASDGPESVGALAELDGPAPKTTVRSAGVEPSPEQERAERDDDHAPSSRPSLSIEIEEQDDGPSDAERLRQRLDGMLDGLSVAARVAGEHCRHAGAAASRGARWVAARAQSAGTAIAARRAALPIRRTASAPRFSRSGAPRAQAGRTADAPARRRPPRRALAAGALVATVALAAWLGRGSSQGEAVAKPLAPVPAAPAPANGAPASTPIITEEAPPPPSQRPRVLVPPEDGEPEDVTEPAGVVAQVPLFGPTSLGPARGSEPRSARAPLQKRSLARLEPNPAFEAPAPRAPSKPRSAAEFSSGRLHLPTIHRLRLDQPGAALRGERTPTGFDVIIPGRKTMESGTAIARRDQRIAKVSTKNGSDGARVSFRFRSDIPAYKVRLKNDYVEFFISAP